MPLKTKPEPGPLVCLQCGIHANAPYDVGDVCRCGGSFQAVYYGWLCSVDNDRFEPMDYGEEHIDGLDEPTPSILLRRGARMAAFESKDAAEEALKASNRAMKEMGSDALQRGVFCLVRIIGRDKR